MIPTTQYEKIDEFALDMASLAKPMVRYTFVLTAIVFVLHLFINGFPTLTVSGFIFGLLLFILFYILLIFLHELCHLIGFLLFTSSTFSSLTIGLNLKKGIAYATTSEYMTIKGARKSIMLPFWLTGIMPLIAGIYFDLLPLTLVSASLLVGAIADIMMDRKLKTLDKDLFILDSTTEPKFSIYRKKESLN
ncbi:DUF3267 domain-containing protein [Kurthia sibirica]|uniref:DUF3267 domain-containing protein n=1 Tax=Kurthia sibirica TaxID=202750 RepID=UPI001173F8E4|nr:DUF3267 domain-containing protein [Kurthia sibirica]GEK35085.1 hypothetical protein KSI01_26180 [Kurthia sibirica]